MSNPKLGRHLYDLVVKLRPLVFTLVLSSLLTGLAIGALPRAEVMHQSLLYKIALVGLPLLGVVVACYRIYLMAQAMIRVSHTIYGCNPVPETLDPFVKASCR